MSDCICSVSPEPLDHFFNKFGMVVYNDDEAMCRAEKLVHCLQCQGHSESLYNQNMTIFTISSKLLVCLQPILVWQYSIISQSALWKNGITVYKLKVTAKVQNLSEWLSGWYFLNHRTFCYQIWYCDVASWARVMRTFCCCCYLQGQGHSKGSCDKNMTLSTLSELFIS